MMKIIALWIVISQRYYFVFVIELNLTTNTRDVIIFEFSNRNPRAG